MKKIINNILFVFLCIVIFISVQMTFASVIVNGESMSPTYTNHDLLLGCKLSYNKAFPKRGDVVVVDGKNYNIDVNIIKRVVALPGESIEIKDGRVYINNKIIDEPYTKDIIKKDMKKQVVPKNSVFVMGDNRNNSLDSRVFGSVNIKDIVAKIIIDNPYFSKIGHILDFF